MPPFPFFVIAGLGIALFPRWLQGPAVAIIGTLAFVNLTPYYWIDAKPRWDLAAALIQRAVENHDLILVADVWVPHMMNVYLSRKGDVLPRRQWTTDVDVAITRLADGTPVWAVFGQVGQVDRENLESFLHRISPLGSPAAEMRAGLDVVILKFAAPPIKTSVKH